MSRGPEDPATPLLGSVPVGSPAHRQLSEALRALREQAPDEETAALYDDILAGRRSARDLVTSEAFNRAAEAGLQRYEERLADMSPQERERFEQRAAREAEGLDHPRP
ncbi:hypothetical protein [Pseudactinotalea sp. HY158]|uniref:hypothetical protein n=1 Tax=Pseudactinotalea sp. HY158 TaxID=2654547 RepID=UPI00129CC406|nr:hypothetical protein [Pseudactinotalea sp. HY158]QGH69108.1 hypothetical protein GCE65_06000 [Pseudactinotalea sp. HY158]